MSKQPVIPRTIPLPSSAPTHAGQRANTARLTKNLHRLGGAVIATFLLAHIANHLMALQGPAAHIKVMESLRLVYRQPLLQGILLALLASQTASGLLFLARGAWRRPGFGRLQAYTGAYLALFLLIHLSAIAYGRLVLKLDTNFYYAAAGLNIAPLPLFFAPYYFLAVVALFAHLACALHRLLHQRLNAKTRNIIAFITLGAGIVTGALIIAAFSGWVQPVVIPAIYRATFS